jgi:hypothetical protein
VRSGFGLTVLLLGNVLGMMICAQVWGQLSLCL